jgi:predicted TIM-barrel fold metal-dependent hydrolase
MNTAFTNAHTHIFTVNHAPDYFLKTAIRNTKLAEWVDKFLQKDGTRFIMKGILRLFTIFSPAKRDIIRRYIEFVEIGSSASQMDIFRPLSKYYARFEGGHKIIVLTQVLDYLDMEIPSNHIRIQAQVEEVRALKQNALYQQNIYPFLGLDPRQTGFSLRDDWVRKYISPEAGFYGIKIYPAAGFFPFDKRLDEVWKWAADNQIPVMTHCTRSGSFYLGRFESILGSGNFPVESLNPDAASMPSILQRVRQVGGDASIHKKNKVWCNVFGHPENYRPILDKYPNLKICLAHLGGSTEVNRAGNVRNPEYPDYLQDNWYEEVIHLMKDYQYVYSDISYTLSDAKALNTIALRFRQADMSDKWGRPLIEKLMYGTDFYLTQQEKSGDEPDLQSLFLNQFLPAEIRDLAYDNPTAYLTSVIHP